jgi:XTP/dITP diphosphohydrolase
MGDKKDMHYNFNMIIPRLIDSFDHFDCERAKNILKSINRNCMNIKEECNMKKIVFVTSNEGKVKTAQKHLENIELVYYKFDLIEPRSESLEEIAKYKVLQAYEQVKCDCIALDSGFFIESLEGWPGTFVNFNLKKLGLEGIIKLLSDVKNRNAYFVECLAYYDGKDIKYFYGMSKGTISQNVSSVDDPNQWSSLWRIFIPLNHTKTLAEMSEEERNNRVDGHTSSFIEFKDWFDKKN